MIVFKSRSALNVFEFLKDETHVLQLINLIKYAAPILTGIVLARLVGKSAELEQFELFLFYYVALTFAANWAVLQNFNATWRRQPEAGRLQVLAHSWAMLAAAGTLGAIIWLGAQFYAQDFSVSAQVWGAGYFLLHTLAGLYEYAQLLRKKRKLALIYVFATQAVFFLIWGGAFYFSLGVDLAIAALTVFAALRCAVSAWHLEGLSALRAFDRSKFRGQLGKTLPLAGAFLITGSAAQIDGALVKGLLPAGAFLLYRYGSRELPVTQIMSSSLTLSAAGNISAAQGDEKARQTALTDLRKHVRKIALIGFPISAALLLFSERLYALVYGPEFVASAEALDIFLLLIIPRLLLPQAVLIGLDQTRLMFRVSAVEWALHVGLSAALIPLLGIAGAAWAALAANVFEKTALIVLCRRFGYHPLELAPVRLFALFSCGLIALFAVKKLLLTPFLF